MQIPPTPSTVSETDLMRRLELYAEGTATWISGGSVLTESQKRACRILHTRMVSFVEQVIAPMLDRTTARELEAFTMHDRSHGHKVAHLMWHILQPERRKQLTPAEIGLLVSAAYFHDLGLALTPEEREDRLRPDSDLWEQLDFDPALRSNIDRLKREITNPTVPEALDATEIEEFIARRRQRAELELFQSYEVLLSRDTRDRHASRERYREVLDRLDGYSRRDRESAEHVQAVFSFEGDSFLRQLISVCVSHNEDALALLERDPDNPARPRFPQDLPVGSCSADLQLIAAALRLADILDFDRERTPVALYYYLLPTHLSALENRSVLEWGKHLTISHWHIEDDAIVYRGRSTDHIIHHAVVEFGNTIQQEIESTHAIYKSTGVGTWPFRLPLQVRIDIHEEGYRYLPYRFQLDDERVYDLLMGGAIYDEPLASIRELIQNAVDACQLRDALAALDNEAIEPERRIVVRYEDATEAIPNPRLSVIDRGVGMDAAIIEQFLLKIGRSYYNSTEFSDIRARLRRAGLDFAPVSDFGIGFLSSFLLADRVTIDTAMFESLHGDTHRRTLLIDGPTRLIRVHERENLGIGRHKGTRVTLDLVRGTAVKPSEPPTWNAIANYIRAVCQNLPYVLTLEHVSDGSMTTEEVHPRGVSLDLDPLLEEHALRIQVEDADAGIHGEIALFNPYTLRLAERRDFGERPVRVAEERIDISTHGFRSMGQRDPNAVVLRGGFVVSTLPGLPETWYASSAGTGRIALTWAGAPNRRYSLTSLARDRLTDTARLADTVQEHWLSYLLEHVDELPLGQVRHLQAGIGQASWLERFPAIAIYKLARQAWVLSLGKDAEAGEAALGRWEGGDGPSLWLKSMADLRSNLLDLVLPRVCNYIYGPQGTFYVDPPVDNWREILDEWRTFVVEPIRVPRFMDYMGGRQHRLLDEYASEEVLNADYKERVLAAFPETEIDSLLSTLSALVRAGDLQRPAQLSPNEAEIASKAAEAFGDLVIGKLEKEWRIDELVRTS